MSGLSKETGARQDQANELVWKESQMTQHTLVVLQYDYMWKDGTIACRECDKEVGTYDGEFGPTFIDEEHRKIWYDERSRSLGSVRNRNDEDQGEA